MLNLAGNYSNPSKFTGKYNGWQGVAPGQHPKNLSRNLLHFPLLTLSLKWPLTQGDIEVFKDMPIEKLDLENCEELTGEWARKGVDQCGLILKYTTRWSTG